MAPIFQGAIVARNGIDEAAGVSEMFIFNNGGRVSPIRAVEAEQCLFFKGVEDHNNEILSNWVFTKLREFGPFLGLSYEGCEKEIVDLFRFIERQSRKGMGDGESMSMMNKRLKSELKRLESSVNYDRKAVTAGKEGTRKGKGVV